MFRSKNHYPDLYKYYIIQSKSQLTENSLYQRIQKIYMVELSKGVCSLCICFAEIPDLIVCNIKVCIVRL